METKFVGKTQSENSDLDRVETFERKNFESDSKAYILMSMAGVITTATQFKIHLNREDSFFDLRNSFVQMEVLIRQNVDANTPYADKNSIQHKILFGIWLFGELFFVRKKL